MAFGGDIDRVGERLLVFERDISLGSARVGFVFEFEFEFEFELEIEVGLNED